MRIDVTRSSPLTHCERTLGNAASLVQARCAHGTLTLHGALKLHGRILTFLVLIVMSVGAPPLNADPTSDVRKDDQRAGVAVTVSGADVRASVTENGCDLTLSVDGKRAIRIDLPESEDVSEVRIGIWMNTGIALAIETRNTKTKELSYFWATARVDVQEANVGQPVVSRFLTSEIDYDVVGVVNSQSDSISITLLRHERRNNSQHFDGQIYVNNCPVGPGVQGVLIPVTAHTSGTKGKP